MNEGLCKICVKELEMCKSDAGVYYTICKDCSIVGAIEFLRSKLYNPILDDPCQPWCSLYNHGETCKCEKCTELYNLSNPDLIKIKDVTSDMPSQKE
jgi:hypothetical protein